MLEHIKAMNSFLEAVDWRNPRYLKMRGDASKRTYYRLEKQGKTAILVYSPPEEIYPFIKIAQLLRAKDYSAPRIYGSDPAKGFMLLEDLGSSSFNHLLEGTAKRGEQPGERQLYTLAVNVLVRLAKDFSVEDVSCFLPPYDRQTFADEHNLLTEWAFRELSPTAKKEFAEILGTLVGEVAKKMPSCMVLRDYHVDNLMYIPSRPGIAACGLLDFQDALCGPVGYDLASLLDDVRRQVPAPLKADMLALAAKGYRVQASDLRTAVNILSAQRLCKIIGIFTRLAERDKKTSYTALLPFTWKLLNQKLGTKPLESLKLWFDKNIPMKMRTGSRQ